MLVFDATTDSAKPIELVSSNALQSWLDQTSDRTRAWASQAKFKGEANEFFSIPDNSGVPSSVVVGMGKQASIASIGALAHKLPPGRYYLKNAAPEDTYVLALGWGMGAYRFKKYLTKDDQAEESAQLLIDPKFASVQDELDSLTLSRDLINIPAGDMLPDNLENAVRKVAVKFGLNLSVTKGDQLLEAGYRTIHAVGRASVSEPRLLDFSWGNEHAPKLTILGKGVCFDSGGLDIKNAAGMREMKKDMAGSAIALGLAHLIMARKLRVRLRLLIPAVENAISSNAYHPGDIIHTYKGTTVEIGNTDAEGRLILCDALTLGAEDKPELMIDFATLTGAARVALGPELPAMFCNRDEVAEGLLKSGLSTDEPVWRLPLFNNYRAMLKSPIADMSNIGSQPMGGAITAALYLEHFVNDVPWVHFDLMGSNRRTRPAHPEGGESSVLRGVFHYLHERFGSE